MDKGKLSIAFWAVAFLFLGGCSAAPSCTPVPGDLNGNNLNEEYLIALLAAAILYGLWKFLRNRRK